MTAQSLWGRTARKVGGLARSDFGTKAGWFTVLLGFDRLIAVGQTVMLSRLLGITDYGAYGVLFATLGVVTTIVGFQSGLAATVFVSRHLHTDPAKVAGVIGSLTKLAIGISTVVVLALIPFYREASVFLYHRSGYEQATLIGILLISGAVWSGIQDGFAQGFESFRFLASLRVAIGIVSLPLTFFSAREFGLVGALIVMLAMMLPRTFILKAHVNRLRRKFNIPRSGEPLSARSLFLDFALPTVGVGALSGLANWFGIYWLSSHAGGLSAVAVATTGLQWRGPALLITSALGTVAIPRFSRHHGAGDHDNSARLRNKLAWISGLVAIAGTLPLVLFSPLVMSAYGPGFHAGAFAFSLVVLSTVPMVISNVYLQEMIGAAMMWRQFWVQLPYAALLTLLFAALIPTLGATGYGIAMVTGTFFLLALMIFSDRFARRKNRSRPLNSDEAETLIALQAGEMK
ncbi:oligosaccharide flippase family protein [Sphingomonas sp.]|uniref:oligosaccharide flippase family protein n=1 Tax=Sphingomonas sp. TaxID=28214 RepID=UPI00325FC55C